jgi:hypothetical protein
MKRFVVSLVAAMAMLLPAGSPALAASCKGASHSPTLTGGSVSPASGTPTTLVSFRVVYSDTAGCIPSTVTVAIPSVGTFAMSTGETDIASGVTYELKMTLPVGTHTYAFSATSGVGHGEKTVTYSAVKPVNVVIVVPPPPKPTPKPTPVLTPVPTPVPTPIPTRAPVVATPAPPTFVPPVRTAPAIPAASVPPTATPAPPTTPPTATPTPTPEPADLVTPPRNRPSGHRSPGETRPAGFAPDSALPLPMMAALLATIAGLGFSWLALRRRSEPEPSTVTATASTDAASSGPEAVVHVSPLPPMRELIPPVAASLLEEEDDRIAPREDEANTPRWLRQSLREARFTDHRYRERGSYD